MSKHFCRCQLFSLFASVALCDPAFLELRAGEGKNARMAGVDVKIDLEKYSVSRDDFPEVTFSQDSKLLCVWWGSGLFKPMHFVVFERDGNLLGSSRNSSRAELLRKFPDVA